METGPQVNTPYHQTLRPSPLSNYFQFTIRTTNETLIRSVVMRQACMLQSFQQRKCAFSVRNYKYVTSLRSRHGSDKPLHEFGMFVIDIHCSCEVQRIQLSYARTDNIVKNDARCSKNLALHPTFLQHSSCMLTPIVLGTILPIDRSAFKTRKYAHDWTPGPVDHLIDKTDTRNGPSAVLLLQAFDKHVYALISGIDDTHLYRTFPPGSPSRLTHDLRDGHSPKLLDRLLTTTRTQPERVSRP
ncbi:hypothetical protein CHIBA101_0804 [Actinomyces sp. Chiba101]|nr:hypothetical protein CHIBA101_0804 [Actinomyces sp. Chiba101]GAV94366.1 hypothetical protein ADENT20671_1135 [Actinomyces denticolens]